MPTSIQQLRTYLPEHDLMAVSGTPAVYHCHHFNLFLDQTVDDALGEEAGEQQRFISAREASRTFLGTLCTMKGAVTPVEKVECAAEVFAAMGHGRLNIAADASGGEATGEFLHYGFSWREKYGQRVRRRRPADAFAAGYVAAALELAYDLPREIMGARETACVATRQERCHFDLRRTAGTSTPPLAPVREEDLVKHLRPTFKGRDEETIAGVAKGLREFTAGVSGDARGLVQAFGVFVTMHLAGYYNRLCYDVITKYEKDNPRSIPVLESLLRESGHVCVFNTFGGILASPEWEGMVGKHSGDPQPIVAGCLAIARALGFGHWTLHEFEPNKRLVVRAPATYESIYYLARHGTATRGNEYFLQGASLAIAQLAHRAKWTERPQFTQEFYDALFRGGDLPWKVEQTASTAMGHPHSEVVVTHVD